MANIEIPLWNTKLVRRNANHKKENLLVSTNVRHFMHRLVFEEEKIFYSKLIETNWTGALGLNQKVVIALIRVWLWLRLNSCEKVIWRVKGLLSTPDPNSSNFSPRV